MTTAQPEVRNRRSEVGDQATDLGAGASTLNAQLSTNLHIALLTGGGDKPYAIGMGSALSSAEMLVDFIGSDELSVPELLGDSRINFLNLRGDQRPEATASSKVFRILKYYVKLIRYATTAKPGLFHLLWDNKFVFFDRTVLMLYYRLLGKKVVFTAHNVNAGKRDLNDSWANRLSLTIQYRLCDHIFVHTPGMKRELMADFRIPDEKVSVVPFGINNTCPDTSLSSAEARRQLGLEPIDKTLLFFGNIAPYKGLEYLIEAFAELLKSDPTYRLVIVGSPKGPQAYQDQLQRALSERRDVKSRTIEKIEYVSDEVTELYFKAADVSILPYTHVFQSGVLFLGYSFGLPAIAADVGNLREEIIEGKTGFVFRPKDPMDLASRIKDYFNSDLFRNLNVNREYIKRYANERYSWNKVAAITTAVYSKLAASAP